MVPELGAPDASASWPGTSTGQVLIDRLGAVRSSVADAARAAGRDPASITTIVVTKFHPASLVRELYGLGVLDFGESRHQEAKPKAAELADLPITWHFVGQLQGKKARQVAQYARVLHSVDRLSLVDALTGALPAGERVQCFLQVNLSSDPARGGVAVTELDQLAEAVQKIPALWLRGVMAIAPLGEEPSRAFSRLRSASERLRTIVPDADAISAGMSSDYRDAIHEGATHLRIGAAITGNRPRAG